jgi:hypothetical protein
MNLAWANELLRGEIVKASCTKFNHNDPCQNDMNVIQCAVNKKLCAQLMEDESTRWNGVAEQKQSGSLAIAPALSSDLHDLFQLELPTPKETSWFLTFYTYPSIRRLAKAFNDMEDLQKGEVKGQIMTACRGSTELKEECPSFVTAIGNQDSSKAVDVLRAGIVKAVCGALRENCNSVACQEDKSTCRNLEILVGVDLHGSSSDGTSDISLTQAPTTAAPTEGKQPVGGNQIPGKQNPGAKAPGKQNPGENLPGKQSPGSQVPGKKIPGGGMPSLQKPPIVIMPKPSKACTDLAGTVAKDDAGQELDCATLASSGFCQDPGVEKVCPVSCGSCGSQKKIAAPQQIPVSASVIH